MVDFELTSEQEGLKKLAREFGEKELAPIAAEIDEKDVMPWDVWQKMNRPPYRFTSVYIPEEFGGLGMGFLAAALVIEELAYFCPTFAASMEQIGLNIIIAAGTEEQKKKLIPPILRGDEYGITLALTEPAAGSDTSAIETISQRDGDYYIINGRKRYASFADVRPYVLVVTKTPELGPRAVNVFLVERDNPGLEVVEKIPCMGLRGHQDVEIALNDCRVPTKNLVGEEGKGLRAAMSTFDNTRATLCSGFIGLARSGLDAAVDRAKSRMVFGRPLAEYQAISFAAAEVACLIDAARLLTWRACRMGDKGVSHNNETAMAKIMASDAVLKATDLGVKAYGGMGCSKRFPVERYYRDARTWTFAQGTPEILKLIVARHLFDMKLR